MIGHHQIVQARKTGHRPRAVFLHVGPARSVGRVDIPIESELAAGYLPSVYTQGAQPGTVDMRWLVGLRVHVTAEGLSQEGFWAWWDAICAAKPAHAIGVEPDGGVVEWRA